MAPKTGHWAVNQNNRKVTPTNGGVPTYVNKNRAAPKTKSELTAMLREAVENTRAMESSDS